MKKILLVVGTRPNIIKVSQFPLQFKKAGFDLKIVHTGQHFDPSMADVFFEQLNVRPDFFLGVGSLSANSQIAEIMKRLEEVILNQFRPDLLIVVGDVNSTLAGALTANKMNIRLAHVESGLRSFDPSMPEEFNRIITDQLSDLLFVSEQSGITNLKKEGKKEEQLFFVGNTMIDSLVAFKAEITSSKVLEAIGSHAQEYLLVTMHRPATVDRKEGLQFIFDILSSVPSSFKTVFPVHPRTLHNMKQFGMFEKFSGLKNLVLSGPQDYFAFQKLVSSAKIIITDSGGIQEESTFYGVPCLTLRPGTERPSTVELGTNELVPMNSSSVIEKTDLLLSGKTKKGTIPPLWDGKASERIVSVLKEKLL